MKNFAVNYACAALRVLAEFVARMAACVPSLNSKYQLRKRLGGPWLNVSGVPRLWLHGASLGECKMLLSLARAIREDLPECPAMLLTTQKAEIISTLKEMCGTLAEVSIAPADFASTMKSFARKVKPVALILGENELWPGFLECKFPVMLVSGRFHRVLPCAKLQAISFAAMQTKNDARRLSRSGALSCIPSVGGNWKLLSWARGGNAVDRQQSPSVDVALVSFHREEMIAFAKLAHSLTDKEKSVVLVPRRLEEIVYFRAVLQSQKIPELRWPNVERGAVSIVDKFGLVADILKASGKVVVGGSFAKTLGVHDFWEPLCAGCDTFVGPYARGAEDSVKELVQSGSLIRLKGLTAEALERRSNLAPLEGERLKILDSYAQLLRFLKGRLS